MDKILLLGEIKDDALCIEEYLEDKYRVQRCSMISENVEGMFRIIKPDLVIACQLGDDEETQIIYKLIRANYSKVPILLVSSKEEWELYKKGFDWDHWETLFTPLDRDELRLKCSVMISDSREDSEDISDNGRQRILLVDDNAIVLRNIKTLLQEKYDISLAVSGEQALKMMGKRKVDLVLLDYEMPEMSGQETFERIRKMDKYRKLPVVFLTGVSEKEKIVEVLKLNPAGYLLKPPKQDKLLALIDEILGNK